MEVSVLSIWGKIDYAIMDLRPQQGALLLTWINFEPQHG